VYRATVSLASQTRELIFGRKHQSTGPSQMFFIISLIAGGMRGGFGHRL
jgi:hypothetical protein